MRTDKMDIKVVFIGAFILSLSALLGSDGADVVTKFYSDPPTVKVGGRVVLKCSATRGDSFSIVRIRKYFHDTDQQVMLSTNGFAEPSIQHYSRYATGHNQTDDKNIMLWLSITNVMPEDTGNFSCFTAEEKSVHNLTLNVTVEPESVELTVDGEAIRDGAKKEYAAGTHAVECKAINSNPAASVVIKYDNKEQTHQMEYKTDVMISPPDRTHAFLRRVQYNTTAILKNFMFDMYQARPLTCEARVDNTTQPKRVTFTPSIKGAPPRFKCDDVFYIRKSMDKVTINCTVFSNPDMTSTSFHWKSISDNKTTIRIEGSPVITKSDNDMYNYAAEVTQHHENKWQFSMHLNFSSISEAINRKMVNSTYFFVAKNRLGPTQHEVNLLQDPDDPSLVSGARVLVTSVINMLAAALFCASIFLF